MPRRASPSYAFNILITLIATMSDFGTSWYARSLNEVDTEIAKLATICQVRILDPGVISRVLQNDASVCGTTNPAAFSKLRSLLMMHYEIRDQAVSSVGEETTKKMLEMIVEKLKERIGERLGGPPSAAG